MKTAALLLVAVLAVSAVFTVIYTCNFFNASNPAAGVDECYFGVTCGFNTTRESETVIDKVKNFTNLIIIDSWDLTQNETVLNEICDYAANAGLKFIVYFDLISGTSPPMPAFYPWHKEWLTTAEDRWGNKFLGIYLHDELGGKQIDEQRYVQKASDYADAANKFVANITSMGSMMWARNNSIPLFTADYALYWWDYLSGYDTVFVELGSNVSTPQQIALCRGAADMQGKDWGAIITWKYSEHPYIGNGTEIYNDMLYAYTAGAKYVTVFNWAPYPETNPYGVLADEHFDAMKSFNDYVQAHPRSSDGKTKASVALVLPANYGWGARRANEGVWGLWPANETTTVIWDDVNNLSNRYGLSLDIIFDDARLSAAGKYDRVYLWNASIT